jgi:hypothetical protein
MTNYNNVGKSSGEVQLLKIQNEHKQKNEVIPLGIRFPLSRGTKSYESLFKMNTDILSQVSNNYKTFLTTKKGEVVCKPDFGLSISEIYNRTDLENEDLENIIMKEIGAATNKYFPFIKLLDFESKLVELENKKDAAYNKIIIRYSIEGFEDKSITFEMMLRRSI